MFRVVHGRLHGHLHQMQSYLQEALQEWYVHVPTITMCLAPTDDWWIQAGLAAVEAAVLNERRARKQDAKERKCYMKMLEKADMRKFMEGPD